MKKNFIRKSLLTAALAVSVLAGGVASADTMIENFSDLKTFIGTGSTETVGNFKNNITGVNANIGAVERDGLTVNGNGYYIDGNTYSGFSVGQAINSFVMNDIKMKNFVSSGYGAAVNNIGAITGISGAFENNFATSNSGGAIFNGLESGLSTLKFTAVIDNINADFTGNTSKYDGGAIANIAYVNNAESSATINSIDGNFTSNKSSSVGGAIYNCSSSKSKAEIGEIKGDFTDNIATNFGGAIYINNTGASTSNSKIGTIMADFTHNSATESFAKGGAIANSGGEIGKIGLDADNKVTFTNNGLQTISDNETVVTEYGGAIANKGKITDIYADFDGNKSTYAGGAIYQEISPSVDATVEITNITGNFTNNAVEAIKHDALGGVIYNSAKAKATEDLTTNATSKIANLTGDFKDNYAQSFAGNAKGGVIYNLSSVGNNGGTENSNAIIGDITGKNVEGNFAQSVAQTDASSATASAQGGMIFNQSKATTAKATIGNISGEKFEGNFAQAVAHSDVANATASAQGGLIFNDGPGAKITSLTGNFSKNSATAEATVNGNSNANATAQGGVIYNNGEITTLSGDFSENYAGVVALGGNLAVNAEARGGAIYNGINGTIDSVAADFTSNYTAYSVDGESGYSPAFVSQGGAIYNAGIIKGIGTSEKSVTFKDNGYKLVNAAMPATIEGGAICNIGEITDVYADFTGNKAAADGGAIYNTGKITINDSSFTGNKAHNLGGAIANKGAILNFTGKNDFTSNSTSQYGGAIANNDGRISEIKGDFTGNFSASNTSYAYGGAIYNSTIASDAEIGNITGNFKDNYVFSIKSDAKGGAIYNSGKMNDITGNFEGNYAHSVTDAFGGAIYNYKNPGNAEMGNITGNFKDNSVMSINNSYGGAIFTANATMGNITGNFTNNSATSIAAAEVNGGAIANYAFDTHTSQVGDIKGDFDKNYVSGDFSANGGAIFNVARGDKTAVAKATINSIDGKFTGNNAKADDYAHGGAIFNAALSNETAPNGTESTIGSINGDFTENTIQAKIVTGGAISNYVMNGKKASIGNMTSNFKDNVATAKNTSGSAEAFGGGIFNYAETSDDTSPASAIIGDITGSFTGNSLTVNSTNNSLAQGAAIYNGITGKGEATLGTINGDFKDNTITVYNGGAFGGAISSEASGENAKATIGNIKGSFEGNKIGIESSAPVQAAGAGIFNWAIDSGVANLNDIKGKFKNNSIVINRFSDEVTYADNTSEIYGGAVYSGGETGGYASINLLEGDFEGNSIKITDNYAGSIVKAFGGAIANEDNAVINSIKGNFTNNSIEITADNSTSTALGGAIFNSGTIKDIQGNFTGNSATAANAYGGAIWNNATINNVTGTFENNTASGGGAIWNNNGTIKITDSTFKTNKAKSEQGGAIVAAGYTTVNIDNTTFTQNEAAAFGGAIDVRDYAKLTVNKSKFDGNKAVTSNGGAINTNGIIEVTNSEFENNVAAQGGAIYAFSGSATINDTTFKGNAASNLGGAIYNDSSANTLISNVIFEDNWIGTEESKVYNDIYNNGWLYIAGNVSMTGGITGNGRTTINNGAELTLLHDVDGNLATLKQDRIYINGGTLNLQNGVAEALPKMYLASASVANFKLDFNEEFDQVSIVPAVDPLNVAVTGIKMYSDTDLGSSHKWLTSSTAINDDTATKDVNGATAEYFYTWNEDAVTHVDPSDPYIYNLKVTGKDLISTLNINQVIQGYGAAASGENYEVIFNYDMTEDKDLTVHEIGGADRVLNIDGNGFALKGNGTGSGLVVASGQTLSLENTTMKDFVKDGSGAAILNNGTVSNLGSNFEGNKATSTTDNVFGGAISNNGIVGNITGNFDGNSANSTYWSVLGGAVYNNGTTGDITGNITGNSANSDYIAFGGAIFNFAGTIGNITGDITGNSAAGKYFAQGGAIFNNSATIGDITGNISGNSVTSSSAYSYDSASGGAILNADGTIGDITGTLSGNSAKGSNAYGGAIYNYGEIGAIAADITGNSAIATNGYATGGAILNNGKIASVTGNLSDNSVTSVNYAANGGAIYNSNEIGAIAANFTGNKASAIDADAKGGAFANYGTTELLAGNFSSNQATATNGNAKGGAIYNDNTINTIIGQFTDNHVGCITAKGGAIYNAGTVDSIVADFTGNNATGEVSGFGGAIYNEGTISSLSGNFENNFASGETAQGGAIYNAATGDISIVDSSFRNNYVVENGVKKANDITNEGTIQLTGRNNMNGGINGSGSTTIGDGKTATKLTLHGPATIRQQEVVLNNALLDFDTHSGINLAGVNTFVFNGGAINLQNGSATPLVFNNVQFNNSVITTAVDVDLANATMDSMNAVSVSGAGLINVANLNILSDAIADYTEVNFSTTPGLANKVIYTGNTTIKTSPIVQYEVGYNGGTGNFSFEKGFTPEILASSVAQQGMFLTQINTYEQAFANMDMRMLMTKDQRTAMKQANKMAADATNGLVSYSPVNAPETDKGMWFRPFASFESVGLKNGPDFDNNNYGGLIGFDSDLKELSHGWDFVWGLYAGYNGSHQNYQGNSIYQNGGTLGANATWYKDNFFTGLTANVGLSIADANTVFGREDMTMLATGIASKTGYNWELLDSRFIIQPSLLLSYSFINTFNYNNAAGISMESDPLNAIQVAPGLKFIGNLPHGWQPYVGVQLIWNILDKTKFSANDVSLSEMSVDPYVQYGLGLQKSWGERFTGFGQVMFRNGGRTGISLNAGFKWAFGHKGEKSNTKAGVMHGSDRTINLSAK